VAILAVTDDQDDILATAKFVMADDRRVGSVSTVFDGRGRAEKPRGAAFFFFFKFGFLSLLLRTWVQERLFYLAHS